MVAERRRGRAAYHTRQIYRVGEIGPRSSTLRLGVRLGAAAAEERSPDQTAAPTAHSEKPVISTPVQPAAVKIGAATPPRSVRPMK
jgi:hypothetical protein